MEKVSLTLAQVLDKIGELKDVFKFTEKVFPLLQELVEFMQEVVPLLEEINDKIEESTAKMPVASSKINDVTSATELATTEILDRVDNIYNTLTTIENTLKEVENTRSKKQEILKDILEEAKQTSRGKELVDKFNSIEICDNALNDLQNKISEINQETYNITLALQVQDITAQQLASVNHLIANVHKKLVKLINNLYASNLEETVSTISSLEGPAEGTFDPKAQYDTSSVRQNEIDNLIAEQNSENQNKKEVSSQDDIDKLFSGEANE